ncbi:MAG: outer membrane beta-barrel protein [Ginsengibacter sp.]
MNFAKTFLMVIVLAPNFLFAQKTKDSTNKVSFCIAIGPNLTKASLASYTPTEPSWGRRTSSSYAAGLDINFFVNVPLGKSVSFRPELGFKLLNQKQMYSNSKIIDEELSSNFRDKLTESQLTLATLLSIETKYFSIDFGPSAGLITSAKINSVSKTVAYNGVMIDKEQTDFKKDKKANDVVFSGLLGISKINIYQNFGAGLYYNIGFPDYTQYYRMRKIAKVNGLMLQLTASL